MIGDVHGCYDELAALLQHCNFKQGTDTLIFNGDMVNKGPRSIEVIDFIESVGALAVRGNQDDKALAEWARWKQGAHLAAGWAWLEGLTDDHATWLNQLPFSISIPSRNVIVVHAGMVPGISLHDQTLETLTEIRDLPEPTNLHTSEKGLESLPSDARQQPAIADAIAARVPSAAAAHLEVPWGSLWRGPQHIFFGHDAKRRLQTWPAATGLDTGCCYGGLLTACILPVKQDLKHFRSSASHPPAHVLNHPSCAAEATPRGPTLAELQASLIMVPAKHVYHVKRKKGPAAD